MTGLNFYGRFKKHPPKNNKERFMGETLNQLLTLRGSPVPVKQSSGVGFILTYNGGFSYRERGNTNQAFRERH